MKRWIFSALAALLMMSGLVYWLVTHYHFQASALLNLPRRFVFIGLAIAFTDLTLRGLRLHLVTRQVGEKLSWRKAVQICLAVDFFAAITPSRLGGEPARMVGLVRNGMQISKALIVLGLEGLMDLGYLALAVPAFLIMAHGHESHTVRLISSLITGLVLLVGVPTLFMMLRERYVVGIFSWMRRYLPTLHDLISGFNRIHPEKSLLALRANLLQALRGPKWYLPVGILCTCGWWVLRFSALIWITQSLGAKVTFVQAFWPQFLIWNSMIFVPVPVSGGLFEASFLAIYQDMIPAAIMPMTVILWRFFTFYLFIIVGAVTTTRSMWKLTMKRLAKDKNKPPVTTDFQNQSETI